MNSATTKSNEIAHVKVDATHEINKVSATVMTISAASIGCWALTCLFAATVSTGGPLGLLSSLVTTITG